MIVSQSVKVGHYCHDVGRPVMNPQARPFSGSMRGETSAMLKATTTLVP